MALATGKSEAERSATGVIFVSDPINKPPHYTATAIEPIEVIEAWKLGFCLGNVLKYVARAELKGAALEDLKKARWYLDREIKKRERESQ